MASDLQQRLFTALDALVLIDPHTHINPHQPAARNLADLLGYHYYTELAHSAGLSKELIEDPTLSPRDQARLLVEHLGPLKNTIQYSWLIELAQTFLDFPDPHLTVANWEAVYDTAEQRMGAPDWAEHVLHASRLEAVFLTNEFDDALVGWDPHRYVPCLRADDLVFRLDDPHVRTRLAAAAHSSLTSLHDLRQAIGGLFEHFVGHQARACAISLPADFTPAPVPEGRAATAWSNTCRANGPVDPRDRLALSHFVFWTLVQYCADFRLPFDLMIGVQRGVYAQGVYQGRDLYDSRVSLVQYAALFNAFPQVTFPVSVLASVTNQELTSYAWIFPNVATCGHWWYSNTPAFIERDLAARLEAVPQTKQIGYYSDMYKLEFALPKFRMYKRALAKVLAERFVLDRHWSEEQAVALGRQVLRGNVERLFYADAPAG